jgi:hypothetical protein
MTRKLPLRRRQRGIAAMLALLILVMGSLYALLTSVNTASAELEQRRDERSQDALRQAKAALIAWSARHSGQPGGLPCPDTNGDGYADTDSWPGDGAVDAVPTAADDVTRHNSALAGAYCSTAARRIGRLPWRTLGLPDLRDASGQPLWYALSDSFRLLGARVINSETQGQLNVLGMSPPNYVAIVFAPGAATRRNDGATQDRSAPNDVAQYLEGENAGGAADVFEVRTPTPGGFNDRLILVTHQDLFDAVENVVAKRIETEVVPALNAYYTAWGDNYPYAAPFDARPAASLTGGTFGQRDGLLPIDAAAPGSWVSPTSFPTPCGLATVSLPPSGTITSISLGGGMCEVRIDYAEAAIPASPLRFGFRTSSLVGRGFFGNYDEAAQTVQLAPANSVTTVASTNTTYSGLSATIDGTGRGRLTYEATASAASGTITLRMVPRVLVSATLAAGTTGVLQWFFANNWHRLTYYRIAPGVVAGQSGGCTANPPCLTVGGAVPGAATARAVLVLAGRALPTQSATRNTVVPPVPPDAPYLANFFEDDNNEAAALPETPDAFLREFRSMAYNDRVVAVAP